MLHLQSKLHIVYSLTVAIFVATVFGFVGISSPALAQGAGESRDFGLGDTAQKAGLIDDSNAVQPTLSERIGQIIAPIIGLVGSIFFVLIVYAGVMWMTAAGSEERVGKAKKIIVMASVGLLVVIMAYAITYFIGTLLIDDPGVTTSN